MERGGGSWARQFLGTEGGGVPPPASLPRSMKRPQGLADTVRGPNVQTTLRITAS